MKSPKKKLNKNDFGDTKADGVTCVITYDVSLKGNDEAAEFCDAQHPFSPLKAEKRGEQTICTIRECWMDALLALLQAVQKQLDLQARRMDEQRAAIVKLMEKLSALPAANTPLDLHDGHPGMSTMKMLARYYCYWPNIDKISKTK
ncbi:unnamed protein product [Heligmosomoides polygyrus]|uniref:Integrase_H2C2 domain-containing protein n=1 Tax=Heligmosomoides polygyrus TaxID=6339 RepID=A0A183FSS1_HELPZ|nr:unnamed protein product [Heligmosomoides polygyrus]